jgi:CBS domain-containing protein
MVANLLSFAISRHYQPQPVYHALLQQDGVHLPFADPTGSGGGWTARDVMLAEPRFVGPNQTVEEAWRALQDDAAGAWLVGAREHLVGVISREQLEGAMNGGRALEAVSTLAVESPEHVHSDHPVEVVLERLASGEGVLPVVSRHDGGRVEGAITLADVTRFVGKGRRRPVAGD